MSGISGGLERLCSSKTPEEVLELVLGATLEGVVDHDLVSGEVHYSDRWFLLLGFDDERPEESPSLWLRLSHPEDLDEVLMEWHAHLEQGWPFHFVWRMQHALGDYRWIAARSAVHFDEDGTAVRALSLFSDVTDQVSTSQQHLALLRAIPEAILRLSADGRILDVRPGASETAARLLSGLRVGGSLSDPGILQPPARALLEAIGECLSSGSPAALRWHLDEEGGGQTHLELRVAPAGPKEAVVLIGDVSETHKLHERLLQAEKLESIGQLAAGVAHEINTPLQYIGDNARFLEKVFARLCKVVDDYRAAFEQIATEEEVERLREMEETARVAFLLDNSKQAIESCIEGVSRVAEIVVAMKDFSHPGSASPEPMEINHAVQSALRISQNEWKNAAVVECNLAEDLPPVVAFVAEVQRSLLNILVNAAHALRERYGETRNGKILVTTKRFEEGIEITIADNGPGIPEKVQRRIFDPFFTTKGVGKGTGQGLAIAYKTIVERHGGQLFCESTASSGATFVIRLPAVPGGGRRSVVARPASLELNRSLGPTNPPARISIRYSPSTS